MQEIESRKINQRKWSTIELIAKFALFREKLSVGLFLSIQSFRSSDIIFFRISAPFTAIDLSIFSNRENSKMMAKYKEIELEEITEDNREQRKLIPYKKLVVPLRMRSIYWKYFGFPANDDGRILTKAKIVCILCRTQMTYNQNTSNLRMHLISRHRTAIQKIEPDIDIKAIIESSRGKKYKMKEQTKKSLTGKPGNKDVQIVVSESDISDIAIVFPNGEVNTSDYTEVRDVDESYAQSERTEITEAVLSFITGDLISPDIVEGKGFLNLLSNLSGKKLNLLSEHNLTTSCLPTAYNACKEQVFNTITSNCITNLALSIEEWSCIDNVNCISVYMHYLQNGEPCLFTKMLSTTFFTNYESDSYWDIALAKLFSEWNINSNAVTAVLLSSSNEKLKSALRRNGFVILPCFLFVVQDMCTKHCFVYPAMKKILIKCRRLVKLIQEAKIDIEEDDHQELEDDDNDPQSLSFDTPDLWLTTYFMLKNLYKRKNNIAQFIGDTDFGFEDVILKHREWQDVLGILNLFEPLKTIVITLLEEKNSLASLLKPLIWQLNSSKVDISADDSTMIQELKLIIKNILNEAYAEENADNLIQIATTLDPRFKSFMQLDDSFDSQSSLTDLLTHLVKSEETSSPNDEQLQSPDKSLSKRTGRSSINALFGNLSTNKPALSLEDKVKIEVAHYQNENGALLEECPLEWWQLMRSKCPNLSRLASKYHCVPAIVMWYSGCRTFKEYAVFCRKRSLLKTNLLDSLLFLYFNKCMV